MTFLPNNGRSNTLVLALALLALMVPLVLVERTQSLSPQGAVERAWDLAHTSGVYTFQTAIDQQTRAVPSLRSTGRPPRHDYVSLHGEVDQPAERMGLSMWRSLGPEPANALQIRFADQRVVQRVGTGEWQAADVDTMSFAPGGDPLGFLAAATNVKSGPVEKRDFGSVVREYTSYTFGIDGHAFGRYLEQN